MDFQKLLAGDEDAKAEFLSMDFDERTKTFGDYIKGIVGVRHFTPAEINGMAWPIWQVDNFDKQKPDGESNSMKVLRSFATGLRDFKAEERRSAFVQENLAACRRTLVPPPLE